jgi:hypothetical protein
LKNDETLKASILNSNGSYIELESFSGKPTLPKITARAKNLQYLKRNQRVIYRTKEMNPQKLLFKAQNTIPITPTVLLVPETHQPPSRLSSHKPLKSQKKAKLDQNLDYTP